MESILPQSPRRVYAKDTKRKKGKAFHLKKTKERNKKESTAKLTNWTVYKRKREYRFLFLSSVLGKNSLEPKKAVEPRWQTCPPKAKRAGMKPMELETEEGACACRGGDPKARSAGGSTVSRKGLAYLFASFFFAKSMTNPQPKQAERHAKIMGSGWAMAC